MSIAQRILCTKPSICSQQVRALPHLPCPVVVGKDYRVANTFITLEERVGSSRRSCSTPPNAGLLSGETLRSVNKTGVGSGCGRPVLKINLLEELPFSDDSTRCSDSGSTTGSSALDSATIRVGNLPNRAKPERIQAFLKDLGLMSSVDSIYMPLDRRTGVCKGYAFINFTNEAMARQFCEQADGQTLPRSVSPKQMCTSFASQQQVATIPKKMPKTSLDGRTFTAYLWVR